MINRSFPIGGIGELEIYGYAINIFNIRNITNVYSNTGSATNNGINRESLYNYILTSYGENKLKTFKNFIQQIDTQQAEDNFGPPRQIRLGVKLSF
jgi:hypothetical protein